MVLDLKALPMVMEELTEVPRGGPAWPAHRQSAHRLCPIGMNISRVLWRKAAAKDGYLCDGLKS